MIFTGPYHNVMIQISSYSTFGKLKLSIKHFKLKAGLNQRSNRFSEKLSLRPFTQDLIKSRKIISPYFHSNQSGSLRDNLKKGKMGISELISALNQVILS
jgi:hypothetical protein